MGGHMCLIFPGEKEQDPRSLRIIVEDDFYNFLVLKIFDFLNISFHFPQGGLKLCVVVDSEVVVVVGVAG